jgi:hypothetical protein
MKKQLASLIILIACLVAVSGCKKDDNKPPTKTDILTAKAWKLQDILAFGQNVTTLGLSSYLGSLTNADFKFNRDGTYTATNRTTNAASQGKWEFGSNETQLILDKGTQDETIYEIVTLTNANLDLRRSIIKSTIDATLLPDNLRALLLLAPANIQVDIKLVPAP